MSGHATCYCCIAVYYSGWVTRLRKVCIRTQRWELRISLERCAMRGSVWLISVRMTGFGSERIHCACAYALRTTNGTALCGERNGAAFPARFCTCAHLHTGGYRALLIDNFFKWTRFVCDVEARSSACVPYSRQQKQPSVATGNWRLRLFLHLRSHSSAPASCKFLCSSSILHVLLSGHVTYARFFFLLLDFSFIHAVWFLAGLRSFLTMRNAAFCTARLEARQYMEFASCGLQDHVPSWERSQTRLLAPKASSRPTPRSCGRRTL